VLENRWKQLIRQTDGKAPEVDWMGIQREVEVGLGRRMRRELQVEPLILCLVQPAPGGTPPYKGLVDDEPDDRSVSRNRGDRDAASGGRRAPAPAPVKVAAAVAETSTTANASDQSDLKTQSELSDVPSGRTRRRRSAAA